MRSSGNRKAARRGGFTLVELLVAIGLTLFIMTIIVEAFTLAMDSYQGFRTAGDLMTQVRGGLYLLRNDLGQNHFDANRRLSDPYFWSDPRREGFFYVQGSAPRVEGTDLDGIDTSSVATDHVIHFSNRLKGNRRDRLVTESATAALATSQLNREAMILPTTDTTSVSGQWTEVAYFLRPMVGPSGGSVTIPDPNPSGVPITLYNLYRTQLLVVPYADSASTAVDFNNNILKMFSRKGTAGANNKFQFFSPNDLTRGPSFRSFSPSAPDVTRASLVCSNVVSFQIRIMKSSGTTFEELSGPFDSMTQQNYRLTGVQIILRVFDPSTGAARQGTLVQDL